MLQRTDCMKLAIFKTERHIKQKIRPSTAVSVQNTTLALLCVETVLISSSTADNFPSFPKVSVQCSI